MAQQNNKRKRGAESTPEPEEPPSPIVFLARGIKADTRLTVFKQEFHLNSSGLKHHSNYFRKFLDSVGKQPAPVSAVFKYDYRSVIDEDGSWALMPAAETEEVVDEMIALVDRPEKEIEAFRQLLCAMNSKKYAILSADQLRRLTRLADYYCALPTVSATLTGALLNSPIFYDLGGLGVWGANAMKKSLIHTVSRWDKLPLSETEVIRRDKELHTLVRLKLGDLHTSIAKAQLALIAPFLNEENTFDELLGHDNYLSRVDEQDVIGSVHWFRDLHDHALDSYCGSMLYSNFTGNRIDLISSILTNNLSLDCTGADAGEKGSVYRKAFLCTDIEDDEYPWDLEEIDW